ncbi:probable ADP-ribosylation factor GTPase-activating protein AGD14 isoform X2 [Durio zibethinus]|uniref:Probable ADP-ribosylation factor GTPase-activating protein AGD14 isoform X2 n=1 Tax=Durio zibethinus TaxID=66656 RepID=A0A6P5WTA7_DURZI|nr:probable ADP-ribosylation factor GTPase-activating protein AGD14 isoform X2 [Durio zibethinus]
MGSRKEEEKNERIIRGLMKLPPNRRCINCNSLAPQYVCTNFWTFVCMACSGIHREFTHRVKYVSMSKFTLQEVEALQNGGNQRARDIYLKDWDLQRQRLPDSSNADKIREFIKNVYVDRKYAGGKTSDKPPRDMQSPRNHEDDVRRASSYHSYSQSPPYDYQYEDRRYGKQVAAALSRKPGSDRGHYVGKVSSFVYSPGRLSDQMFEDRFANEGSIPRVSDYSVSSGGDPFKSGTGSPNFHRDIGFGSPTSQPQRDVLSEDTQHQTSNLFVDPSSKKDAEGIPHPQRTKSMGSFGSFDSNSMSIKSYNSGIGLDVVSEPEETAGSCHDKASTLAPPSLPVNYGGLDLFNVPEASSAPPIDLFQLPATSSVSSENIFQPAAASSMLPGNLYQPSPSTPSIDLFSGIAEQLPAASFDGKSPELSISKNEGWATFDTPQHAASGPVTKHLSPAVMPSDGDLAVKFDQLSSLNTTMQWPVFEDSSVLRATTAMSSQWPEGLHDGQASTAATGTQSWNAFNDSAESLSLEPQVVVYNHLATTEQHLGLGVSKNHDNDGIQTVASYTGFPATLAAEDGVAPSYDPLGVKESQAADCKSTNPFDLPYDSELEQNDLFLDMSSLQTALPNAHLPSTFLGGVQPWFPQNPVTPYIPATPQGGLAYMSGQAPSSQIPNVPAQGPVASIGRNPFA